MNFIVYIAIIFSIAALSWIYYDSKIRKGTKVFITWSKFIDDREVIWHPEKRLFGYNIYNKDLQVEMFKLPKIMGGQIIEGLNPDDMEATNKSYPKVHLVQIGENTFVPKKREDYLAEFEQTPKPNKRILIDEHHSGDTDKPKKLFFSSAREYLADKDVQGWGRMMSKYNDEIHAERKKGFDKYSALVIPAIAMIIAFLIVGAAINKSGDIMSDANGQIKEETGKLTSLVNNFINNQNSNTAVQDTEAARPPAAQGSG